MICSKGHEYPWGELECETCRDILDSTEADLLNAAKNVTKTLRLPTLEAAIAAYEEARR